MKTHPVFILFFILLFNCSPGDSSDDSRNIFVVNDFTIIMDENPSQYQLIGTIPSEVYQGLYAVRFFITSQNVSDAIYIVEGEIHVNDPLLFDFETNPKIVANVRAEKGGWYNFAWSVEDTKIITVTINLNDLPD